MGVVEVGRTAKTQNMYMHKIKNKIVVNVRIMLTDLCCVDGLTTRFLNVYPVTHSHSHTRTNMFVHIANRSEHSSSVKLWSCGSWEQLCKFKCYEHRTVEQRFYNQKRVWVCVSYFEFVKR